MADPSAPLSGTGESGLAQRVTVTEGEISRLSQPPRETELGNRDHHGSLAHTTNPPFTHRSGSISVANARKGLLEGASVRGRLAYEKTRTCGLPFTANKTPPLAQPSTSKALRRKLKNSSTNGSMFIPTPGDLDRCAGAFQSPGPARC